MQSQAFLDRLMADISRHLPGDLGQLRQEVEHSVRAVLNETLTRLDLISREEFEIQQQVLERAPGSRPWKKRWRRWKSAPEHLTPAHRRGRPT